MRKTSFLAVFQRKIKPLSHTGGKNFRSTIDFLVIQEKNMLMNEAPRHWISQPGILNRPCLYAPCCPVRWVQMLVCGFAFHKKQCFHSNTVMVLRFAGLWFCVCLASWLFQHWNMGV